MAVDVIYSFEIDDLYTILSGDTELLAVINKYVTIGEPPSDTLLRMYEITLPNIESSTAEQAYTLLRLKILSKLLLENRTYLAEKNINTLLEEEFLFVEIGKIFEYNYLPIPFYHQVFYSYKYSTIRNFFRKNYQNFLPEIDYFYIQDQEKLKLFIESMLRELDKFSDIIDSIYHLPDIDQVPSEYVKYLAQLIGYEREDSLLLKDASYRELVKNIIEIYKIKGTNYSFELFLNFLGFDIVLYEYWFDRRLFYSKKSKNEYTGVSDRKNIYFYLTPIKPTDVVYDFLTKKTSVADGDISEAKNIFEFNDLANSGVLLENLLGFSSLDENGDPYTGKTYTYFKTNAVDYNVKKIKLKIGNNAEEISSSDLQIINKYVDFLTPIFVVKNIIFGLNEYEDRFGFLSDFNETLLYVATNYLEDILSLPLDTSFLVDLGNLGDYIDVYKSLRKSNNAFNYKGQPKLMFSAGQKTTSKKTFSPLLYLPLENDTKDASGYANPITTQGSITYVPWVKNNTAYFDGTKRIYTTLNNTIFNSSYSISVWVYFQTNSAFFIVDSSNIANNGGGISLDYSYTSAGKITFTHYKTNNTTPSSITSNTSLYYNTWANITVVWNPADYTQRYLYINGVLDTAVSSNNGAGVAGSYYFTVGGIGNPSNTSNRMVGCIKNVKVIDKLLTTAEVEENYDIDRATGIEEAVKYLTKFKSPYNYWKMGGYTVDYPNAAAGTLNFEDFSTTSSYTLDNATHVIDGGLSRLTSTGLNGTWPIYHKAVAGMVAGKIVRAKIRVTSGTIGNMRVGDYSAYPNTYQSIALTNTDAWQIKTITLTGSFSTLGFCPNDALYGGAKTDVEWIYVGDGTSSAIITDYGTNGNNGTYVDLTEETGVINNGSLFNGTSSKITLNSSYSTSSGTIMFWAKTTSVAVQHLFFGTYGSWFFQAPGTFVVFSSSGNTSWSLLPYRDGNYHHFAIVKDATTVTLYCDGISKGTQNLSGTISINRIGTDTSNFFSGSLDEIYTFQTILSEEEIRKYYSSIKHRIDWFSNSLNKLKLIPYIKDEVYLKVKKI